MTSAGSGTDCSKVNNSQAWFKAVAWGPWGRMPPRVACSAPQRQRATVAWEGTAWQAQARTRHSVVAPSSSSSTSSHSFSDAGVAAERAGTVDNQSRASRSAGPSQAPAAAAMAAPCTHQRQLMMHATHSCSTGTTCSHPVLQCTRAPQPSAPPPGLACVGLACGLQARVHPPVLRLLLLLLKHPRLALVRQLWARWEAIGGESERP